MKKISLLFFIIFAISTNNLKANYDFNQWLVDFKITAIKKGISKNTVNAVMNDAKFLPKVIEYDRYQPEFYEDTYTYIGKRANKEKVRKGISLYKKEMLKEWIELPKIFITSSKTKTGIDEIKEFIQEIKSSSR